MLRRNLVYYHDGVVDVDIIAVSLSGKPFL